MDADVVADLLQPVTQESLLAEEASRPKASRAKGQPPQAVAAARGRLRRRRSSPMRPGIAFVASPCIRPRGARNVTHTLFQQPARHLLARSYVMVRAVGCASTPAAPAVRLRPRQVRRGGLRRADPPAAHLRKGKASATLCLLGTVEEGARGAETMAAEILAAHLEFDLYRIDLAS